MIEVSVVVAAALLFFWGSYSFLDYRSAKKEWSKEMKTYYEIEKKRKSVFVVLGERFDKTEYAKEFARELSRIGMKLTPSEFYAILLFVAGFVIYGLIQLVGVPPLFAILIGIGSVEGIKRAIFMLRKLKYQQMFEDSLSEVCRLLANSARAGLSIQQGIELVGKEAPYPANIEFSKISHELLLGISLEALLSRLQHKYSSRELNILIATLQVQKEAGGNLAEALSEMSQTLDERKILKQMIKTQTSEQRYVAYILPFMPVGLLLIMNSMIEGFIDPLFTPIGMIFLILFIVGIVIGFVLIKKVTRIKV